MKFIALLLIAVGALPAQDVNLNQWTTEFAKVAVGAREDVQFSVYRKESEVGKLHLEFQNRKSRDVKVSFRIVDKYVSSGGTAIAMTGFIKANSYWPNGYDKVINCAFKDPVVEIKDVTIGEVEETQIIETNSEGGQVERYKYSFRSDADIAREKKQPH